MANGIANTLVPSAEQAIAPHSIEGMFKGDHVFPESDEEYSGSPAAAPAKHLFPSLDVTIVNQFSGGAFPRIHVSPKFVEE